MAANIIDGKAFAATVREKVAGHVARLKEEHDITPGLAVVLVGEDPASQVYVRSKGKQTVEAGMNSFEHKLDADTSEAVRKMTELTNRTFRLNVTTTGPLGQGQIVRADVKFGQNLCNLLRGRIHPGFRKTRSFAIGRIHHVSAEKEYPPGLPSSST